MAVSVVSVSQSLLNSYDIRTSVVLERMFVSRFSDTQRPVTVTAVRYVSICMYSMRDQSGYV